MMVVSVGRGGSHDDGVCRERGDSYDDGVCREG